MGIVIIGDYDKACTEAQALEKSMEGLTVDYDINGKFLTNLPVVSNMLIINSRERPCGIE